MERPLATFVGELFHHFFGLGFEASVKAVLALSIVVSGFAMYGFVRSWLGRNAGLVAAVAFMAIPYHLVDVYVRAALAESVALAFLPLALWGFRETVRRPRWATIVAAGFAYAAIMWTSNLVALIFTPGLAAYVAILIYWHYREAEADPSSPPLLRSLARLLLPPALAFALGLGLSAAFFVPALVEQGYINRTQWFGEYYDPTQHFVYFFQLFNPSWGFGISQPGPDDVAQGAMSFQLGAAATLLSLVALVTARRLKPSLRREVWFWGLWVAVSIFLTLNVSALAWRYVPIVPYAQFPWRYLMLAILPLSILPGTLVADSKLQIANRKSQIASPLWPAFLLSALVLLSSFPYLRIEIREPTVEQGPVSYAALMRFQRTSDEMTGVTAWVDAQKRPIWSDMADLWVQGKPVKTRVDYSQVPQNKTLAVNSEDVGSAHEQVYWYAEGPGQSITFNRFWYPGWTAWLLDGKDAGRGIGRGIASVFANEGARVVVVNRSEESGIETVKMIERSGGEAFFVQADISINSDVERMARSAVERFGRIDILCPNAGIYFPGKKLEDITEHEWDHVNAVNLKGTFLSVKACLPQMISQNYGRIVITSSITGPKTGIPGQAHYAATKAGINGFIRTAALDLAKYNITVNGIEPGNILTETLQKLGQDHVKGMEESIPLGRLGRPEDVAYAMVFLASDVADWITGITIVVDGGQILPESKFNIG